MVLEVVGLKKRFGRFFALTGVDLEVKPGEIYGFIGPNGAGKTTTMRVILGILQATSGRALVFGKDAWHDAVEIHKRVAYVPGDVSLWPNLTGGETIDFLLRLRSGPANSRRDELIEKFDLDPSKKCSAYSKGNRQKVALIAAFASESDLYVLDEPTAGLDPLMEQVFQECVREVKSRGKSVLLSSHVLSEVEKICDRVSIIREGQIIESGTLEELRHLTRITISAAAAEPITGLEGLRGVHGFREQSDAVYFSVDSEALSSVLKHLSQFELTKLESAPPTLEDLFLRHYQAQKGQGAVQRRA